MPFILYFLNRCNCFSMSEQKFKGWSIIVDCDGCLTNGQKIVDATGQRQMIAFHSRDSVACKMLVEMGFQVIILTHSSYHGIGHYWMKYGAYIHVSEGGDPMTNKLDIENWESVKIDWEKTIGIGDDITDDCFLEKCEFPYLVYDCNTYYQDDKLGGYKYPRFKTWGGDGVFTT